MKVAKKLPKNPSLDEQVNLLKQEVLIQNNLFKKGTAGIIVSLKQNGNMYWVLLNHMYKTKDDNWSRRRLFNENDLRLIDNK